MSLSTEIVASSPDPVFLKMVKPVIGHLFAVGFSQLMVIEVFVVDAITGADVQ